jgi:SAM-dependent methyltransferase
MTNNPKSKIQNPKSLEDTKLFQDLAARYFLEDYQGQQGFSDMGQLLRAAKRAGLERDKVGLDLACGNGRPGLFIIRRLRCHLAGLDLSAEALAIGQHRAERYALQDYVKYQQADLNQPLPFAAETFDGAIGVEQFDEQARNLENLYREVWRVLKPGGGFAFYFRVSTQPDTPWSRPPAEHSALLQKAGFSQTESFDVTWEFGALLARMQRAYEEKGVLDKLRATLGPDLADSLYNEVQELHNQLNAGGLQRYLFSAKK